MKMISIDTVMEILLDKADDLDLEEIRAELEQEWYLENPKKAYAPDLGT